VSGRSGDPLAPPKPPWWPPTLRTIIVLCSTLLLVATGAIGGREYFQYLRRHCAPGVEHSGPAAECVGVTDSGYTFWPDDPGLTAVMNLIADENKQIDQQTDKLRVTVAYLVSAPRGESPQGIRISLRHELQGAYVAQWHANHKDNMDFKDNGPLIRLLVANNGDKANQWEPVVNQLIAQADGHDPLLAVAGLGNSYDTTRQAIARLADHQIPLVGSVISADDMSTIPGQPVRGLARVAPTNTDEAKAAANYLKLRAPNSPLIVHDTNPGDPYPATLDKGFRDQLPGIDIPKETFDSSLSGAGDTFRLMMPNICQHHPDIVYFTGRSTELGNFLDELPSRPCPKLHIDIVTGDSAASLGNLLAAQLNTKDNNITRGLNSNVTLRYTGLAHPGEWPQSDSPLAATFALDSVAYFRTGSTCEHCFSSLFSNEQQDDGRAIMGHDAMLTAITAIRFATHDDQHDLLRYRGEIIQALSQFHNARAVPGASGWISLVAGNPENKAIPILELKPDGVHFIELAAPSPDNKPFVPQNP
jgi:hypothetical protein